MDAPQPSNGSEMLRLREDDYEQIWRILVNAASLGPGMER